MSAPVLTRLRRLLEERLTQVQKRLHVFAGLSRDERDWHVAHGAERMLNEVGVPAHVTLAPIGRVVEHQVPLVDCEDTGLVFLGNIVGELLVEASNTLSGVDKEQDDVGAANRR